MRKMLWLLLLPVAAFAETAYVTDTLRLGLHQAADTSDRPFRNLESGQVMEVLSRTQYYANIQLPDGTRGYVKAGFLVSEKPAKLVVAETQAEIERLTRENMEYKAGERWPFLITGASIPMPAFTWMLPSAVCSR